MPVESRLAAELIQPVTTRDAPAARLPLFAETLTQFWVWATAQFNEDPPVFVTV